MFKSDIKKQSYQVVWVNMKYLGLSIFVASVSLNQHYANKNLRGNTLFKSKRNHENCS